MQNKVVIVSAVRTPLGCFMGSLSNFSAVDLGICALDGALSKIDFDRKEIDELIVGHVLQSGCGQAPAKQIALGAKLKPEIPCSSVNKVCSSGLKAVNLAAQSIQLGINEVVVAGGVESMSNAPYLSQESRNGIRMGHSGLVDHMFLDGLEDAYDQGRLMGTFAEDCE